MDKKELLKRLRNIPDFPKPGIQFKDVDSLFGDKDSFLFMVDQIAALYECKGVTKVVGLEARGFVLGAAVAAKLGAGFVMCRKPGKLPGETMRAVYEKEYGTDALEIHKGAITSEDVVLIHDDLLATGGSLAAVAGMVLQFSPKQLFLNTLIELTEEGLEGRKMLPPGIPYTTLLTI